MSADFENFGGLKGQMKPSAIANEINKRLSNLQGLDTSGIVVHVQNDEVEFSGSLPGRDALEAAVEIALNITGIEKVHWNVEFDEGLRAYGSTHGPGEGPDEEDAPSTHGPGEGPE